jgi:type IV secretory pathway VirB4 component
VRLASGHVAANAHGGVTPEGVYAPGRPRILRLSGQQMSTAQCCSLYPFQNDARLGPRGVLLGVTWPGSSLFYYDPFALYADGVLDNPNLMVFGEPGSGKSSVVKCLISRHVGLLGRGGVGRQAFVVDPKREYEGLAEALGMTRLSLRPGGRQALNPLGRLPGTIETPVERLVRRHHLMAALLSSLAGHSLDRTEDAVLGWALEALGDAEERRSSTSSANLIDLSRLLEEPSEEMAKRGGLSRAELRALCRPLWLLVDKLVRRDLKGMFDGDEALGGAVASSTGIVLDVSAVFSDKALLRLVMLAAISVLQACYLVGDAGDEWAVPRRFLVVDECWSLLGQEETARFLQENWKLGRARGVANVAVCHRVTDLSAQADSDSATAKIGEGLVSDTQTHVVFRTAAHVAEKTADSLGLTPTEKQTVMRLPKATALWKVRGRSAFVRHLRSPYEEGFTDTDARVAG